MPPPLPLWALWENWLPPDPFLPLPPKGTQALSPFPLPHKVEGGGGEWRGGRGEGKIGPPSSKKFVHKPPLSKGGWGREGKPAVPSPPYGPKGFGAGRWGEWEWTWCGTGFGPIWRGDNLWQILLIRCNIKSY
jgi:hypothetical protein